MRKLLAFELALLLAVTPLWAMQGWGGKAGIGGKAGFGGGYVAPTGPTFSAPTLAGTNTCTSGVTTCNVTVTASPTSNAVIACAMITFPGAASTKISSCSGGGGTWTLCAASGCFNSLSTNFEDFAYNVTPSSSTTTITVNLTAAPSTASWAAFVIYALCTANCGTLALDGLGAPYSTASCSTACQGPSFSGLTGTSDVCLTLASVSGTPSSPSSPWAFDGTGDILYLINSAGPSGHPTFTNTPSGQVLVTGACFL
jgi:hypothetical protein